MIRLIRGGAWPACGYGGGRADDRRGRLCPSAEACETAAPDSHKFNGTESEAWALGGSAGFKTGYFRDLFAIGATGYASQRLYGPEDKDGACGALNSGR
jgi:hypothetical protein